MGKINMATATINSLLTLVQTAFNANRLQVQYGGTGVTNYNALRSQLGLGDDTTQPLPVERGGTGATSLAGLKGAILSGGSGVIPIEQGGTGRASLTNNSVLVGKGTNAVGMITPSAGTGVFLIKVEKVPLALGGTGVSTRSELSNLLGLGTATTETNYVVTYNPIPVGRGGTGVTSYGDLNKALGLSMDPNGSMTSGAQVSGAISISRGGTGATNATDARNNFNAVNKTGDNIENDFILNGRLYIKNDKVTPNTTQYDVTSRFTNIETSISPLTSLPATVQNLDSSITALQNSLNALERRVNTLEARQAT